MRQRSTILLTGFGPFPGVPENSSALFASKLAHLAARWFPGHRVVGRVLPTEWEAAPVHLMRLYTREQPKVALHFGVSERATGFVIETLARNVRGLAADAKGGTAGGPSVADGGPATLAARVPALDIVERLGALDLPACLSDDAGTYLCNAVLYQSLTLAAKNGAAAGFVHIPTRLGPQSEATPVSKRREGPLHWEGALEGGLEIVRVCLGRPPPARVKRR
jgi:pyroglutamyl-peptidase